eukprot:TRINITY_DN2563_c0_g1_i1.p1 TRINITY_DN2563_c0_g1~~TRINITY_DN2563_c0_g1_i1.p1  ORF type:complete len:201 (-),score=43.99 TRINITY_DN2563_c0_g1_i1:64-666(-)
MAGRQDNSLLDVIHSLDFYNVKVIHTIEYMQRKDYYQRDNLVQHLMKEMKSKKTEVSHEKWKNLKKFDMDKSRKYYRSTSLPSIRDAQKKEPYVGIPDYLPVFPEKYFYASTRVTDKPILSEAEYKKVQTKQRRHSEVELAKIMMNTEEDKSKQPGAPQTKMDIESSGAENKDPKANPFVESIDSINKIQLDDISKSQFF